MTPATSTGLAPVATKFSALETLDLTKATPEPTAHLRFGETTNAAFDPQNKKTYQLSNANGIGYPIYYYRQFFSRT